jgi:hypothetical protein
VEKLCETRSSFVSREALSLDISRVVSRVVSGESIDTAENGAALAAKYPDLGMSPALISQAIERAAGMVGMIKSAPAPAKFERPAAPVAKPIPATVTILRPEPRSPVVAPPPPVAKTAAAKPAAIPLRAIGDDLAAAIDAEIGNLVQGQKAKPAAPEKPAPAKAQEVAQPVANPVVAVAQTQAEKPVDFPEVVDEGVFESAAHAEKPEPAPAEAKSVEPAAFSDFPEPEKPTPTQSSIFASFRRALFRT